MFKSLEKIRKRIEEEREREFEEIKNNLRDLKSLYNLINDEEENENDKQLYNCLIYEFDNIIRYPPESNPPINYFDNPYSRQKGLNSIFNRFVTDNKSLN